MSFDAWVVGFGFSRVLIDLEVLASPMAYSALLAAALIDAYLLYIYFIKRQRLGLASTPSFEGVTLRRK